MTETIKRNKWKRLGLTAGLGLGVTLIAAGCSATEDTAAMEDTVGKGQKIELAYVEWDDAVATNHVVAQGLEDLGYDVTLTPLDNAIMWEAVSTGEADAMLSAWLPGTHGAQMEEYGDKMVDLGGNLEGAKIGLAVPAYMDVDSIADLTDQAGKSITGIEPGAGIVAAAENALTGYPNLSDWAIETSSSGAMTVTLGQAIENEEEIIITAWNPHWKFSAYDLKYLDDPNGIFGGEETVHTMVREGLETDMPEAYQVLDQFHWTIEDVEALMLQIYEGESAEDAAAAFVEANPDLVAEWTAGVAK